MKISTNRNPDLDKVIRAELQLCGKIHPRTIFMMLKSEAHLPIEHIDDFASDRWDFVEWCYLDFCKYLAIYWSCVPRSDSKPKKASPFDEFARRQLKLTED